MARRVIRCNVNNLLLAVIVIESVFLGWYFLGWLMAPPGMSALSPPANDTDTKKPKIKNVKVEMKEGWKEEEAWTPESIATWFLAGGLVLFFFQVLALANLILGYLKQNFKPLYIWLLWFILSTLFLLIGGIWLAVVADQWLPETLLTSGYQHVVINSKGGKNPPIQDDVPKGPIMEITTRMANRINCFLGPLLFLKIVLGIFEVFAVLMSIKYFKQLQPAGPPSGTELQETKEALVA